MTSDATTPEVTTAEVTASTRAAVNLRRAMPIAAGLGAVSFVVLAPMGYPLAAAFFCGGLALGSAQHGAGTAFRSAFRGQW